MYKKGHKHSEEVKKKISEKLKGRKFSEETRNKFSEKAKGHIVTKETRKKISDAFRRKAIGLTKNNKSRKVKSIWTEEFKERFDDALNNFISYEG